MTTVIAARGRRGVIFGSDSQVSTQWTKHQLDHSKILQTGPYTIGFAGDARAFLALKVATLPKPEKKLENYGSFVLNELLPALRKSEENQTLKEGSAYYLVSFFGNVYQLNTKHGDISLGASHSEIGSGSGYAGAYLSGLGKRHFTQEDVLGALKTAASTDLYTAGPFHIVKAY